MNAWFLMEKIDNGYRAEIKGYLAVVYDECKYVATNIALAGREMFNRNFHEYAAGEVLEVLVDIKESGRRFVKRTGKGDGIRTYVMLREEETEPVKETEKEKSAPHSGFYVSEEARLIFNTALTMLKKNPKRAVKVLVVGPSGYGKTSLPRIVSQLTGMSFKRMNCATIRDPEEWFGYREARDGSTHFIHSDFGRQIQAGNLVVVLDEFNRLEPWLHNTLFPLLDDDGATMVHDEQFVIGESVLAVATINTGYKYTGTFELDEALVNRFDFVLEVGPLPHNEEVKVLMRRVPGLSANDADIMTSLSTALRQAGAVCSIRTTLLIANMMASGMTMREAFDSAVIRRIPQHDGISTERKQIVDLVNAKLGPLTARSLKIDIFSHSEEEVQPKSTTVVLKVQIDNAAGHIGLVTLMSVLRSLDYADGRKVSFKQAREVAEAVKQGAPLLLELASEPQAETITHLETAGLCVSCEVL